VNEKPSPSLSLLVQAETECQSMLEVCRREAEEIRRKALREAALHLEEERARLEIEVDSCVRETVDAGRREIESASEEARGRLVELRSRVNGRVPEAVRIIVAAVADREQER
jgi:vacuolar-type H+-ATPase subunit H